MKMLMTILETRGLLTGVSTSHLMIRLLRHHTCMQLPVLFVTQCVIRVIPTLI